MTLQWQDVTPHLNTLFIAPSSSSMFRLESPGISICFVFKFDWVYLPDASHIHPHCFSLLQVLNISLKSIFHCYFSSEDLHLGSSSKVLAEYSSQNIIHPKVFDLAPTWCPRLTTLSQICPGILSHGKHFWLKMRKTTTTKTTTKFQQKFYRRE